MGFGITQSKSDLTLTTVNFVTWEKNLSGLWSLSLFICEMGTMITFSLVVLRVH